MKAQFRCREHYQGDRCTLEAGHPGENHKGNFSIWSPTRVVPIAFSDGPQAPRLSRGARQTLRRISCGTMAHGADRKRAIDWLDNVVRFLRQNKPQTI